jgi:hypothetical protein
MTDEQVFDAYEQRFGVPLQHPPLCYGHTSLTTGELVRYARKALKAGKPINWDEHLAPLPPGALS